jgi:telomere length regulation protein
MIVATAIARLADGQEKAMDFGTEELETESAKKWLDLVNVEDEVGAINDLRSQVDEPEPMVVDIPAPALIQKKPAQAERSKIIAIEEISDEDEDEISEDEDLIPYQKPDDDPEDSDDDPTLVNRNKPVAPVYIIDLIKQLQSGEDKLDVVELALKTAPSLIRRKADFGTEVSDNIQALASALINLKSPAVDSDEMHGLRLQSLIACLVAQPAAVAPWLAAMYFEGDFSLDQRASILSTLGLGAREISGLSTPNNTVTSNGAAIEADPFPSKHLPYHSKEPRQQRRLPFAYTRPLTTATDQITHTTIQPLALKAADKLSGPDILKIRTFSSRLEVEKRRNEKQAARTKKIPKDLHRVLAEAFFLALVGRMVLILSSAGSGGMLARGSGLFDPNLVRLFLNTVVVVLNALGPNAMWEGTLGEVIRQAVQLLVSLQAKNPRVSMDPAVLPAWMLLLLSVLEVVIANGRAGEERFLGENGEQVAGLVGWVGGLLDQRSGSGGGSEMRVMLGRGDDEEVKEEGQAGMAWNVLAAGVMVRWTEIAGRWQGRVLGLMGVEGWDGGS